MANPRELAEQAFSLLQNALRDSEARASDLDEQLKRKRAPKNKLEEQLDVLTHKLEAVEAERIRWQQQASHLEEIAEAERAKVAQLKKKLEIAESGPEKLTKKEINFWRAKAEDIDTETKDYKTRLASLRREIIERDALIEKLRVDQGVAPPAQDGAVPAPDFEPAAVPTSLASSAEVEDLRWQLEQRESRLTELQTELNELREAQAANDDSGHSLEIQAQIETLRRQVTTIDQALTEAHSARAALKAELAQAHAQLDHEQRASREAQAGFERVRSTVAEREHRLVELSAEVEQIRSELRQREQQMRDSLSQRDADVTALARDLEEARRRAENDRTAVAEVQGEREQLRAQLAEARQRADSSGADLDQLRNALVQREQAERDSLASNQSLQAAIAERDQRLAERDSRLGEQRRRLDEQDQELASQRSQLEQRVEQLQNRQRELADRDQQVADRDRLLADRDRQVQEQERALQDRDQRVQEHERGIQDRDRRLEEHERSLQDRDQQSQGRVRELEERDQQSQQRVRELEERDQQSQQRVRELEERDQQSQERARELQERGRQLQERELELGRDLADRGAAAVAISAELEQARAMLEASDRELSSLRDTLFGANRELALLREHKGRLENELSDVLTRSDAAAATLSQKDEEIRRLVDQQRALESQRDEVREQMSGLESELKEEKDNAENLAELANERREGMTKLQERAEEAEERHEEAKYRLGRAAHFERLVKRRKGLVAKLLAALRAKAKSNVALKAGLDGLRTYKAAAEMNQQKLLQRLETLKQELNEAEEAIARHHGSTQAKEQLATSQSNAASLEQRLNAQAEVIKTLEEDLKTARMVQKSGGEKNQEIERLQKDLERLQKELETKNGVITQMQNDVDDQQRKLAKLRGSESETVRLKAISEKDRSSIDALEREIATLREALAERASAPPAPSPELEAKLKEREQSVTRLMGTIKENEATIKKLTESSDSWKRKYQFLATDSPDAYKNAAEK